MIHCGVMSASTPLGMLRAGGVSLVGESSGMPASMPVGTGTSTAMSVRLVGESSSMY